MAGPTQHSRSSDARPRARRAPANGARPRPAAGSSRSATPGGRQDGSIVRVTRARASGGAAAANSTGPGTRRRATAGSGERPARRPDGRAPARPGGTAAARGARPRPGGGASGGRPPGGRGGGGGHGPGGRGPGGPGGRGPAGPGGRGRGASGENEPAGRSLFGRQRDGGKRRSIIWRWRRPIFLIGLAMLAMLAGVGVVVAQTELPPFRALDQASYICAANDASGPGTCTPENAMTRLQSDDGNRTIIALDKVPEIVVQAVLAMEDRDFYQHDGVNPTGIMRAMFQNVKSRSVQQGGSTITQQYVLNSFSLAREGGIARKLKEAVLSIKLEQQMSKDEILEGYLNTIYFGRGAYGIAAASRAYFDIEVQQITDPGQAALLAGLIRAPNYAEPTEHAEEATRRRKTGLVAMVEEGYITQEQADTAEAIPVAEPWITPLSTVRQTDTLKGATEEDYLATDYLAPYIEQELNAIDPERFSKDVIRGGGLRIYTSLNYDIQRAAVQAVTTNLPEPDDPATPEIEGDPDAALVAVDGDGLVRAMVPSRRRFAAGIHENNYALLRHEPGSNFKPIVLAEALRQNYSAMSRFEAPGSMEMPGWRGGDGEPWNVSNYSDGGEAQVMDMLEATAQSSNTAYAQLMLALGTDEVDTDGDGEPNVAKGPAAVAALAESMGMGEGDVPDIPDDQTQPPMALGSYHTTPLEMAGVYATFMNRGIYREPSIITRVEKVDDDGNVNVLYERRVEDKQILSETQADIVTHALQGVVAEGGTGPNAALDHLPVAGKTGTSQQNRNAWFTGYVPGLTASVWMGYPDNTYDDPSTPDKVENNLWPMNADGRLVHGRPATGGSIPATIWHDFMEIAAANLSGEFAEVPREVLESGTVLNKDLRTRAEQPPPPPDPGPDRPGGPDWPLPDITLPNRPGRPGNSTTTTSSPPTTNPTTTETTEPPVTTEPPGPGGPGGGGGGDGDG